MWDWKRQFLKMERQVSVRPDPPIKEAYLWRWSTYSEKFPSGPKSSIYVSTEISGNFSIMESTHGIYSVLSPSTHKYGNNNDRRDDHNCHNRNYDESQVQSPSSVQLWVSLGPSAHSSICFVTWFYNDTTVNLRVFRD